MIPAHLGPLLAEFYRLQPLVNRLLLLLRGSGSGGLSLNAGAVLRRPVSDLLGQAVALRL
jgi:hypothetical protein